LLVERPEEQIEITGVQGSSPGCKIMSSFATVFRSGLSGWCRRGRHNGLEPSAELCQQAREKGRDEASQGGSDEADVAWGIFAGLACCQLQAR